MYLSYYYSSKLKKYFTACSPQASSTIRCSLIIRWSATSFLFFSSAEMNYKLSPPLIMFWRFANDLNTGFKRTIACVIGIFSISPSKFHIVNEAKMFLCLQTYTLYRNKCLGCMVINQIVSIFAKVYQFQISQSKQWFYFCKKQPSYLIL